MNELNLYHFTDDDLQDVLNFTKNYHLEESKQSSGRTNSGSRNFGGELDAFVPGKLIEIAVCKILEKYTTSDKKLFPDFKIYTDAEVGQHADPDIVTVIENGISRNPNLHIEVKRLSEGDDWLGMRYDQLNNLKNMRGEQILDGMYMVHASLEFEDNNNKKQRDIIGSILKKIQDNDFVKFDEFSDFKDLVCRINYIYSIKDLMSLGYLYPKGGIIPKGEFDQGADAYTKSNDLRKGYQLKNKYNEEVFLNMRIEGSDETTDYGEWKLNGQFDLIKNKSGNELIYCHSNTQMFNKYFGLFNFEQGKTYKFYFINKLGKDTKKGIDDYWFLRRRLEELLKSEEIGSAESYLQKIINSI